MATQYVIRKQIFHYTDEYHTVQNEPEYFMLGEFYQVFNDAKIAQESYRHLILASLRQPEISINGFDCEFTQEFQRLIWEKMGNQSYDLYETGLPPTTLSDDDLLELAHRTGWLPYALFSFEKEKPLYAVWVIPLQKYLIWHIEGACFPVLVGDNGNDLSEKAFCTYRFNSLFHAIAEQTKLCLEGSSEELSDSPELLKQFLALPDTGIMYDAEKRMIEYNPNQSALFQQYLHTFNSLLKKPFYELHPIRPEQIKQVFDHPTVRIV
ncbi:MAG: hypothetical protein VXW65_06880 [Pseudomonadota bacterium]|nr:hypothetical protein [Pseudomonadota bacterium]